MRCKDPISHRQWGAPVATESKHQHAVKPAMSTCCAPGPVAKMRRRHRACTQLESVRAQHAWVPMAHLDWRCAGSGHAAAHTQRLQLRLEKIKRARRRNRPHHLKARLPLQCYRRTPGNMHALACPHACSRGGPRRVSMELPYVTPTANKLRLRVTLIRAESQETEHQDQRRSLGCRMLGAGALTSDFDFLACSIR